MKWITEHKIQALLAVLLACAFIIRVYALDEIPKGFFADEASIGYNAYTLLTFGHDEHGEHYPLFFRAFGEYKNPLQIYLTIPFLSVFGNTVFSVRFTSVILSLVSLFAVFLLTKELTKHLRFSDETALLAVMLLTISPWHIHLSRTPFEGFMPYLILVCFGTYFFLRSRQRISLLYLSVICFSLSLYSYFPARLFVPLFLLGIGIFYIGFFLQHKRKLFFGFLLGTVILLPLIFSTVSGSGLSRWKQISIFTNPPQETSITSHIFTNYLSHYSGDFLFIKGDSDMPGQPVLRHSVKGFGELYLFQFPFLFVGLYYLYAKKQYTQLFILLLWVFLYPVGSMFTMEKSANATRSIIGVVPFQIISAVGIAGSLSMISRFFKKTAAVITALLFIVILFSFYLYAKAYFIQYNLYASGYWGWQYGMAEIVRYFEKHEEDYDELILIPEFNGGQTLLRFYAPHSCRNCFIGYPHERYSESKKQLFALTPEYLTKHPEYPFKSSYFVLYPNNTVAFMIGEIVE